MPARKKTSSARKRTTSKSSAARRRRSSTTTKARRSAPKRKKKATSRKRTTTASARKRSTSSSSKRSKKKTASKRSASRRARTTSSRKKTAKKTKKRATPTSSRRKATAKKKRTTSASSRKTSRPKRSTTKASKRGTTKKRSTTTSKKRSATKATKRSTATKSAKRTPKKSTAKRTTTTSRRRSTSPKSAVQVMDNAPIPSLALEDYTPQITRPEGVRDTSRGSTKVGWIGAGQCGGRLVKSFYDLGYRKVLAVNTAHQDLEELKLPERQKLLMDIGRKGAGKDMNRGREAAQQYRQEIIHAVERIFADDVDHVMVTFGCGGGTGSGSVLPILDTLKDCAKHIGLTKANKRIGVLCTLPTEGESASPKVSTNANEVMNELAKMANNGEISPLIIVDNEKISRLYPGLTVRNFWPTINNTVAGLFDIFNRLSAQPSNYTSFDSVDYQSILECGGACIMGLSKVRAFKDKFDLSKSMKQNLTKTLLADGFDLHTAKVAGAIVVGGKSIFAGTPGLQDSINHAFDVVADLTGNATVHRGVFEDNKSSLRVYTLIGGLHAPVASIDELRMAA